jgi:hypothetical protein
MASALSLRKTLARLPSEVEHLDFKSTKYLRDACLILGQHEKHPTLLMEWWSKVGTCNRTGAKKKLKRGECCG